MDGMYFINGPAQFRRADEPRQEAAVKRRSLVDLSMAQELLQHYDRERLRWIVDDLDLQRNWLKDGEHQSRNRWQYSCHCRVYANSIVSFQANK